jgi:uncharacterized protein (TIGR03437 family)
VNAALSVKAMIDGQAAEVLYAGQAPGFTGLNQMNIMLPAGISSGAHGLAITRAGFFSNQVTILIR